MSTSSAKSSRIKILLAAGQTALAMLFIVSLIAALHPDARSGIRDTVLSDYRMIVSTTKADLANDGIEYTIVKVKTRDGLLLEIYRPEADGQISLAERVVLADSKDGIFKIKRQATKHMVSDIDQDGKAEILAPSFDRDLVGRLNIFKFEDGKGIERVIR
jgi:hypothetical protein